jgi:hypothetical protein|uniref:Uncharacterized protein n=1 Tax=viral metagenome TaxID=1070528 RepID=A0A6C0IYX5_9ZZZZ
MTDLHTDNTFSTKALNVGFAGIRTMLMTCIAGGIALYLVRMGLSVIESIKDFSADPDSYALAFVITRVFVFALYYMYEINIDFENKFPITIAAKSTRLDILGDLGTGSMIYTSFNTITISFIIYDLARRHTFPPGTGYWVGLIIWLVIEIIIFALNIKRIVDILLKARRAITKKIDRISVGLLRRKTISLVNKHKEYAVSTIEEIAELDSKDDIMEIYTINKKAITDALTELKNIVPDENMDTDETILEEKTSTPEDVV